MKLQLKCDGEFLFDSLTDIYKAINIDLTEQVNTTNTLVFTLPPFNPNYSKPQKLTSLIELYRNNELIFEGRVLYTDDDIIGNRTFTCEGSLSFLLDSIQRPKEYHNTSPEAYLQDKINQHNAMVEQSKQFTVGQVTVTNSTDNVYRIDNDYPKTLNNIFDKLVNRLGGYLRVRKLNDTRYLDYIEEYDTVSTQKIEFQKNILDLSQRVSAENIITALIPLGAKDDNDLPLTISSVNGGKDFIYNETAVSLFGYIYGTVDFDDVTVASNLKTKAEEVLNQNLKMNLSISVNAVDLSMLDVEIGTLDLGMSVQVISQPHKLDEYFVIKRKDTKFLSPENSSITLDTIIKRNTDQVSSTNRELQQQVTVKIPNIINDTIKHQTELITGGKGGYVVFGYNEEDKPEELYFLDQPTIDTAKNLIRINKNGIGFSNTGVNGPYVNAWTIDGKLNADFITVGKLVGITLEGNIIKGGSINIGNGVFIVDDNGNLKMTRGTINIGNRFKVDQYGNVEISGNGYFKGNIEGSNISGSTIVGGEINNKSGDYSTILKEGKLSFLYKDAVRSQLYSGIEITSGDDIAGKGALHSTSSLWSDAQIHAEGNIYGRKNAQISGECSARKYITLSDVRLKENFEDIDLIGLFKYINVKMFNYINNDKKTVGVIAQDFIGTEYEDIILSKNKDGYYSVDYNVINMAIAQYIKKVMENDI